MQCEWLTRLERASIARRLEKVDLILGCSDYLIHKVRRAFPELAGHCRTLYNGVDIERFIPNGRSTSLCRGTGRLLWAGRISPEKGLHTLLVAFSEVARRYPAAQLELIGPVAELDLDTLLTCDDPSNVAPLAHFYDGQGYLSHLKQQAISLGLANRVAFRGPVPHRELVRHYQEADVFVFPSLWNELFGMPIIEAMSAGTPVVATRGGGIPELIEDGRTGLLVERNDATAMAGAILRLLGDDNLRESLRNAGRQRVIEHFSWDRIAGELLRHYSEIRPAPPT